MQVRPSAYQEMDALSHNLDVTKRQYFKWVVVLSVVEVDCVYSFSDANWPFQHVAKWRNHLIFFCNCIQNPPPPHQNILTQQAALHLRHNMHRALDAVPSKGSKLAVPLEVKVTLNQLLTLKCLILNLLLPPGHNAKQDCYDSPRAD